MAFDPFFSFLNQISHCWMPQRLCSKNSDQLPVPNRLTDIFAVGKFDYGVMVQYQNLMQKPELLRAPWARAPLGQSPGTMYPLNPLSQALSTGNDTKSAHPHSAAHPLKRVEYCLTFMYSSWWPAILQRMEKTSNENYVWTLLFFFPLLPVVLSLRDVPKMYSEWTEMGGTSSRLGGTAPLAPPERRHFKVLMPQVE